MKPDFPATWTGYHEPPSASTAGPVTCTSVPSTTMVTTLPVFMSGLSRRFAPSPSVFATLNFFGVGVAIAVGAGAAGALLGVGDAVAGDGDDDVGTGDDGANGAACAEYVYAVGSEKRMPPVTISISTAPTGFGGVTAVIVLSSTTRTFVAGMPPKETVAPC